MPPPYYEAMRAIAITLLLTMSFFSSLTNKLAATVLRSDAGKAVVQKSFASWVSAFLRGDDYDSVAGDRLVHPFKNSVWVQRAIKRVAEPIAAVPLDFYQLSTGGDEREITDPNLVAFWEAPGIDRSGPMDRADFIEATVGWLKLAGESFWILDDTWLTQRFAAAPLRAPIIIARPDRMQPVVADNKLVGWTYTDAGGTRHALVRDQVVHRKFWNPYDDIRGLAEYAAARVASESDYLAGKFSLNLNRANGDRGIIAVAKGGVPTDEQQEQITRVLREKANAARRGDFRPVFLSGDVAIEDPKVSSPDSEYIAARLQNRHEIFIAFGVPPSMADIVASYSVGSASDRYLLIQETCMPLANGKISGAIEAVSRLFFVAAAADAGRPIRARFDFDDHPVMQQVRAERLKSLDSLWQKGMPAREASDYLGLSLPEYPGWEIGYLPFNVTPATEASLPAPVPGETTPASPPPATEEPTTIEEAFARRHDPVLLLENAFGCRHTDNSSSASRAPDRDPKRVALANAHLAKRKPVIKAFVSKFTAQLMKARKETLAKLHAAQSAAVAGGADSGLATTRDGSSDFLFDREAFKKGVMDSFRLVAAAALDQAGREFFDEIGFEPKDNPWTMPSDVALQYLHSRENRLANASDEVYDRIKTTLDEGLRKGESMSALADRVRAEFNGLGKDDAMRIASTETGAAYGVARQEAMNEAGVKYKQWLTSGLPNVRPAHAAAEGETVRVDEPFLVGGENLMHPGDPRGSAGNVINCHCVSIAVASKEKTT